MFLSFSDKPRSGTGSPWAHCLPPATEKPLRITGLATPSLSQSRSCTQGPGQLTLSSVPHRPLQPPCPLHPTVLHTLLPSPYPTALYTPCHLHPTALRASLPSTPRHPPHPPPSALRHPRYCATFYIPLPSAVASASDPPWLRGTRAIIHLSNQAGGLGLTCQRQWKHPTGPGGDRAHIGPWQGDEQV